ncbi:MAG: hypothetical protein IH987_09215 [Planctomycetes bacterium]|nr:hypothetical protein [Planctomycetota bacterium]
MVAVQFRVASRFRRHWCVLAAAVLMAQSTNVRAQTAEQTFELRAGWNAVYVEVDPKPSDLDVLLDGLAVTSVWMREEGHLAGGVVPCTDEADASCVVSTNTGWRVWFPPDEPQRAVQSLRALRGGRVYLIEAAQAGTWTIRGRPNSSVTRWPQGFDLAGFHVVDQAESAPTFVQYLSGSPAHRDAAVFEINADGTLARIVDPDQRRISPGRGYWVESSRRTVYDGPIRIDTRSLRGVSLFPGAAKHFIEIENLTDDAGFVAIAERTSQMRDGSPTEADARVPLMWYDFSGGPSPVWRDLDNVQVPLASKGAPGSKRTLRVGARQMELATLGNDDIRGHESVLAVTDGSGFCRLLPLTAQGGSQDGLWVGDVTINEVASPEEDDGDLTPTSSEFMFRIIIHKSGADYRLLREVVLVYQETEQSYLLVTPSCFELLDADVASPRVSTANFAFEDSFPLIGDFATQLVTSLTPYATSIDVGATDALNPFFHPFNPIHDEGFEVKRDLTLTFDADGGGDPEWGTTRLAGTYEENLSGLHRYQIEARGRFELRRVSYIATLCGP